MKTPKKKQFRETKTINKNKWIPFNILLFLLSTFKCLLVFRRASQSLWNERLGFLHILFFIIKNKSICDRITSLNCLLFFQTTHISLYFFSLQKSLADGPRDKHSQSKSNENLGNRLTHKRRQAQEPVHKFFYPRSLFKQGPWDLHANTCILPLASGIWVIWVWAEPATAGLGVESDQSETQWGEGLDHGSGDSGEGVR